MQHIVAQVSLPARAARAPLQSRSRVDVPREAVRVVDTLVGAVHVQGGGAICGETTRRAARFVGDSRIVDNLVQVVRLRVKLGFRQNGFRLAVLAHDDVAIAAEVDVRQVAEGAGAQVCQEVRAHLRPADELGTGGSHPALRESLGILGDSQVARVAVELSAVARVVLDAPRVVSAGVAADNIRKVMT